MSQATRLIVEGYLSPKDRDALEDMRAHRQRLRKQLEDQRSVLEIADRTAQIFDEEIVVIEAALARLAG